MKKRKRGQSMHEQIIITIKSVKGKKAKIRTKRLLQNELLETVMDYTQGDADAEITIKKVTSKKR